MRSISPRGKHTRGARGNHEQPPEMEIGLNRRARFFLCRDCRSNLFLHIIAKSFLDINDAKWRDISTFFY